jgi:hypothetical protein
VGPGAGVEAVVMRNKSHHCSLVSILTELLPPLLKVLTESNKYKLTHWPIPFGARKVVGVFILQSVKFNKCVGALPKPGNGIGLHTMDFSML